MDFVILEDIVKEFKLKLLTKDHSLLNKKIKCAELNRPALQLTGFFDYFDTNRIQIIGKVEYEYLKKMKEQERDRILNKIFSYDIPCIILSRSLEPFPEMIIHGEIHDIPILSSELQTTELIGELIRWIRVELAPTVTMHGVLVDIYGEGVLITGESGIGKSEAALELIKRGHRLVADDAVEIKRISYKKLIGTCPNFIKYFLELRGVGIIDVRKNFGVETVKEKQNIDIVINLETWDENKNYDRIGIEENYMEILNNKVVCHCIPIRPGRNIAIICESAAVNHRQKKMGYDAAKVLRDKIIEEMELN